MKYMLQEAKGIGRFLRELQERTFRRHDSFSVGEVFDADEDEITDFVGDDGYFSSMFDFGTALLGGDPAGWYRRKPVQAKEYIKAVYQSQKRLGDIGFYSNIIENHDEPRGVSHYLPEGECCVEGKKMLALLSFMVKGLPFIYEGQEIGMENKTFASIEEVDDCSTMHEYQVALEAGLTPKQAIEAVGKYCRDNARTPMQWDDSENAGFTTGRPWLAVNPNYKQINVKAQQADEDSVLAFYKKLAALRKSAEYKETIVYGDLILVPQEDANRGFKNCG